LVDGKHPIRSFGEVLMPLLDPQLLDRVRATAYHALRMEQSPHTMLGRLQCLEHRDRALLEMVGKGLGLRAAARVLKMNAGSASRRYHRLVARLRQPLIIALTDPGCELPPATRRIALEVLLSGRAIADVARRHGVDGQEVRQALDLTRHWHRLRAQGLRLVHSA
jgi:DNA-directed RNA polymerase specialized sigma24 family protein